MKILLTIASRIAEVFTHTAETENMQIATRYDDGRLMQTQTTVKTDQRAEMALRVALAHGQNAERAQRLALHVQNAIDTGAKVEVEHDRVRITTPGETWTNMF